MISPKDRQRNGLGLYLRAVTVVVLCTILAAILFPYFNAANLSMVYLTGVVVTALYYGRGPSILATVLSVGTFDFLFIEPYGTFAVSDVQYVLTLLVMLLVAVTVSTLAVRTREQKHLAQQREYRTASLYALSRKISNAKGIENLVEVAVQYLSAEFDNPAQILIPDNNGALHMARVQDEQNNPEPGIGIAQWVYTHGMAAGCGTENIPGSDYLYIPLRALRKVVGVLGIYCVSHQLLAGARSDPQFLQALADQIALAIEGVLLTNEAQQARMQAETERLRSNLLSSVSHDLRTPLASIMGAASTLLEKGLTLDVKTHDELSQLAYEEAQRLNRLVGNLLDMTRLESGGLHIEKGWQTLEEVAGAALRYLGKHRSGHPIVTNLSSDLPLVPMDSVLVEQVLVNLLENAIKYTPAGTSIELSATSTEQVVTVEVADHGPGIVPGDEERIFDKFYRSKTVNSSGVGLGLTICKGIVEAHKGRIWVKNRDSGGAVFSFTLPLEGSQPSFEEEL